MSEDNFIGQRSCVTCKYNNGVSVVGSCDEPCWSCLHDESGLFINWESTSDDTVYCKDCIYCLETNTSYTDMYCAYYHHNKARQGGCDNGKKKMKTNADRIRAMSDEELAKFLQEDVFYEPWCPDDVVCLIGEGCQLTDKDCGKCALKWLKQECEE